MNKLLECTRGPWDADHVHGCKNIRGGRYGGRYPIACTDGLHNDEEDTANAALIAAAFDHALCWWGEKSSNWTFRRVLGGVACYPPDLFMPNVDHITLPADPFGFPILTDDLRDRLIAAMEATQ